MWSRKHLLEHSESFIRIPPGQSIEVECLAGDAIKVGVCFYINDESLVGGKNNCDYDLWRIKKNETVQISYMYVFENRQQYLG